MKQLDWKSFAIGILLTTTVVFGVAAINPTDEKQWDENQKWLVKHFALGTYATKKSITERATFSPTPSRDKSSCLDISMLSIVIFFNILSIDL